MKLNLPEAFIQQMKTLLGQEYSLFEEALNAPTPISVRTNNKTQLQPSNQRVTWCETGYYLNSRPLFTSDPLFHAGAYYVQEASSMFLKHIADHFLTTSKVVLDLCAAPGGKSTLLSNYLSTDCLLISNELIRQRAQILSENMAKWGDDRNIVTNNTAKDFAKLMHFFDAIVVDAPCSGEGMFRKDPDAIQEWSSLAIANCVVRQREIITDSWQALKPNGILIYSTCTYNTYENEGNVQWICDEFDAEVLKIPDVAHEITETNEGYRFYPHKTRGEGFFISIIRKGSTSESLIKNKFKTKTISPKQIDYTKLPNQLLKPENYIYQQHANKIHALSKQFYAEFLIFEQHFNCLMLGIEMYEIKGNDLIPQAQLALSKQLAIENTQTVEVDNKTAIQFLKRESIQLQNTVRGFILLTYHGVALGWVKNVGNRCNNLFPQHWRIRMNL